MIARVFLAAVALLAAVLGPTAGQIDFVCPKPAGLFAHPEQCDRYFECRSYRVTRKLCPDGLVFDPSKVETAEDPCDHVQNTEHRCKGKPKRQRPQPGDGYCPRQNGVYPSPDPSECDKFYSCLNGVGSGHKCAEGLHFDEKIGTCVWARESGRKGCINNAQNSSSKRKKKPQSQSSPSKKDDNGPGDTLPNGFRCPGGKLGIHPALPHPTSCRLYYVCLNGVTPNEAGCAKGLVFNRDTAKCDAPDRVPGCEDTYNRPKPKRQSQRDPPPRSRGGGRQQSDEGDGLDVDQFAKFIELLTNPKVKSILKPEVAEALDTFAGPDQGEEEPVYDDDLEEERPSPGALPRRRQRPGVLRRGRPRPQPPTGPAEDGSAGDVAPEAPRRGAGGRRGHPRLRNRFSSKFIPRVRPVGNLDNLDPRALEPPEEVPLQEIPVTADKDVSEDAEEPRSPPPASPAASQPETKASPLAPSAPNRPTGVLRRRKFPFRRRPGAPGGLRRRPRPQAKESVVEEEQQPADDVAAMGEKLIMSLLRDEGGAEGLSDSETEEFENDFQVCLLSHVVALCYDYELRLNVTRLSPTRIPSRRTSFRNSGTRRWASGCAPGRGDSRSRVLLPS